MRNVDEWIGRTDDSTIPPRVKLRVFERAQGICPKCTRKFQPGQWDCDHIIAIANGGENRESNLQPLCDNPCHSQKTKSDVADKSRSYRKRRANVGIKKRSSFACSKTSRWKKKVSGEVVLRE